MSWWVVRLPGGSFTVVSSTRPPISQGAVAGGPFASRAQAQAALSGMAGPARSTTPVAHAGGCGALAIYQALLNAGFSTVQAIGAMANAIHESSLNPEARARDTNGAFSNGLWQFNEASFPDSGKLVTGNCGHDLAQQVGYLKSHISGNALNGSTGAQVASNFAANFERCQGCQPGGSQNAARTASAATVEGWISSGKWPTSGGSGGGGSGGGGGGGGGPSGQQDSMMLTSTIVSGTCAMPISIPIAGSFCLLSKSQARGILGVLLMIGGGLLVLPGLLVLAAAGLGQTSAGRAAGQAAAATPTIRVARAAQARARPSRARSVPPAAIPSPAAPAPASRRSPVPAPRRAAPPREVADARGTSPEFRRRYFGES